MSIRRWLLGILGVSLAFQLACGTLLYPERHGRRGTRVDPAVLILDGILLLLFVIPGLVAFGIDFYTGAVYMARADGTTAVVQVEPEDLTPARIEAILREHTGQEVHLDDADLQRFRLQPGAKLAEVFRELAAACFDPDAAPTLLAPDPARG